MRLHCQEEEVDNCFLIAGQATSTQSLLIIRCCGNLVPEESPEVRTRLVNEIWETLEKIGGLDLILDVMRTFQLLVY